MRAEVRDDAAALITPFGIADQPCRSVPVEHAAVVDRTEFARGNQIAHAHELRLVRNTGKDGVVAVERYVAQVFVLGLIADRIDRSDVIAARKPFSFATLD